MGLLFAVFETRAGMSFQHSVFRAEMTLTEAAVADDSLSELFALFEAATWLAGGHGE